MPDDLDYREEIELIRKAKDNCEESLNKLIEHHGGHIRNWVKRFCWSFGCGEFREDLESCALMDFKTAIDNFKEGEGACLRTYSRNCVKPKLYDHIRKIAPERNLISRIDRALCREVGREHDALMQGIGEKPTAEEIARRLKIDESEVNRALELLSGGFIPIYDLTSGDDSAIWEPQSADKTPEDQASEKELGYAIKRAISNLPPKYGEVVILRHYEGLNYNEIAERLDISVSAAKIRVHRALDMLRKNSEFINHLRTVWIRRK